MNIRLFDENGRRLTPDEIRQCVLKNTGAYVAEGFSNIISDEGCIYNNNRIASFIDLERGESWYLKQIDGGSIRWRTGSVTQKSKDVIFVFAMAMGNMSTLPQPTGYYDLLFNGNRLLSFRVVKHEVIWAGDSDSVFCFIPKRLETAQPGQSLILDDVLKEASFCAFGLGFLKVPAFLLKSDDTAVIEIIPRSSVTSELFFKLDNARHITGRVDISQGIVSVITGKKERNLGQYSVYFGDIHNHSGESIWGFNLGCGIGSIEENYSYARNISNLDICCISDHDFQMDEELWKKHKAICDDFYEEGKFVTILGFEWTSSLYGHRNVYYYADRYKDSDIPFFVSRPADNYWLKEVDTPDDLWAKLDASGAEAITIPHHPSAAVHPLAWKYYNEKYDRLVEIYSSWGSNEYPDNMYKGNGADRYRDFYVRSALAQGLRYGFLASGDGHDGHPGNAQSPYIKHHHLFHYLGSGWVGVLSTDLTRESIYESLKKRLCYATTGVPIILNITINNCFMGSEVKIKSGEPRVIDIFVRGSAFLNHVDIIKNGKVVYRYSPYEETYTAVFSWKDHGVENKTDYYYARVIQKDGEMAWSSPIWIDVDF